MAVFMVKHQIVRDPCLFPQQRLKLSQKRGGSSLPSSCMSASYTSRST